MNTLSQQRAPVKTLIMTLIGIWLLYLAVMGLLQALGLKFGFNVWPMGEDRNFLGFMDKAKGAKIAHEFWKTNDRNPLSVWWWVLTTPIIKQFDSGLYIIRKCLDPFLAISTFLLLDQLGRQKYRMFAFCVALIVLLWNISAYFEQIIWVYLGALGTNLLTIYFYCRYVDSERTSSRDLGIALILYLFTITTYTLQPGAIIAITCIALFRQPVSQIPISFSKRIKTASWDVGFFAAIFVIYNCVWYTVSRNADVFYVFDFAKFTSQFFSSMKQFIFHYAYSDLWRMTRADFSFWQIAMIVVSAFVLFGFILFNSVSKKIIHAQHKFPIGWVVAVMLSISVSIIILESTSSIWYPGSRSLMVQQVWQPLLYVSAIFIAVNLIPKIGAKLKCHLILMLVAMLGAYSVLLGLDYNHHLVLRTHYQRVLAEGILKLHIPVRESPTYLVRIPPNMNDDVQTFRILISVYGSTMLHRPAILRVLTKDPCPEREPYWSTRFESDEKGVFNAGAIENAASTAYKNLWILFYDGEKVLVPEKVDKSDFEGLKVVWNRKAPVDQTEKANRVKRLL